MSLTLSRRAVVRSAIAGLAGLGMHGMSGPAARALGQGRVRAMMQSYGLICPLGQAGYSGDPPVWYYMAGDCPDDGQYYGMTSSVQLSDLGCPETGGSMSNCVSMYKGPPVPRKQIPLATRRTLIDLSNSPTKAHCFSPKGGGSPPNDGLTNPGDPAMTLQGTGPGMAVIGTNGANYQMIINNRRRAVRVFLVEAKTPKGGKYRIGIGQEVDADPTGLPTFDDERRVEPYAKYYWGYLKDGDQFFHILTKN
jgi:hypothetical protein